MLIEDNPTIARQTGDFLQSHGWQLDFAHNGQLGTELALQNQYDLVLLDLNLPDMDGLEVCQQIKRDAPVNIPVLMLTARDAFADKVQGFSTGADDYLCKPFDLRELALRCQALARRNKLHQSRQLCIGELKIDQRQRSAARNGQSLQLTTIGFDILWLLAQAYPQPVSRSTLIHSIWGAEPPESDALKSHIYSLRRTLDRGHNSPMLKTLNNVGYRLTSEGGSDLGHA
nr:response regulator transcription factor [Microbulbifer celer]